MIVTHAFATSDISFSPLLFKPCLQLVYRHSIFSKVFLTRRLLGSRSRIRFRSLCPLSGSDSNEVCVDHRQHVEDVSKDCIRLCSRRPLGDLRIKAVCRCRVRADDLQERPKRIPRKTRSEIPQLMPSPSQKIIFNSLTMLFCEAREAYYSSKVWPWESR